MGVFYAYGVVTPAGAGEEGLAGSDVTIPQYKRAVIRRFDGSTLEATNTWFYLNNVNVATVNGGAPSHIWAAVHAGIGNVGEDIYVYVDALAAAVNLCASIQMTAGTVQGTGSFSGIYQ